MYAVRQGYADVVEALVGKPDLEVNCVSKEGKTALMYAAEAGDLPIVESLLKHETINTALTDKASHYYCQQPSHVHLIHCFANYYL